MAEEKFAETAAFFRIEIAFFDTDTLEFLVLIVNTFGKKFRESFRILNIVLYYAGQILIGVSLMFL